MADWVEGWEMWVSERRKSLRHIGVLALSHDIGINA
jgi:hypothetical protein